MSNNQNWGNKKNWQDKPPRPPRPPATPPTTIDEICRRYWGCAITLARVMGVSMTDDFLEKHRESVACVFIESGRANVRLSDGVKLPKLGAPQPQAPEPPAAPPAEQGEAPSTMKPASPIKPTSPS